MKNVRSLCGVLVIVTLVGAFILPVVSAQKLDGLWFKLKLSAKGRTLDDATEAVVSKLNFSTTVYAQFVSVGGQHYDIHFWTQTDGTTWANSTTASNVTVIGANENFISDFGLTLVGQQGNSIHTFHTVFIGSKLAGGTGDVLSATYDGVGEVNEGTIVDLGVTNAFFGGCTLKGKTTDASKLPFTVPSSK